MTELKNNLIEIFEDSSFAPFTFEELATISRKDFTLNGKTSKMSTKGMKGCSHRCVTVLFCFIGIIGI